MIQPTGLDTTLRILILIMTGIASLVLSLSVVMRLTRDPRLLTRGQVLAQSGFFLILIGVLYGVGESLWGWYHLRLWILLLGAFWSVVGCFGLLYDALDERRHPEPVAD